MKLRSQVYLARMDKLAHWESTTRPEGPWALMVHHFHRDQDRANPGSITGDQLRNLIEEIQKTHSIVTPGEFFQGLLDGRLSAKHVLFTFDDALRSQFEVALPVLKEYSINALFNVYSGIWSDELPMLEIWSSWRTNAFQDFGEFYQLFLTVYNSSSPQIVEKMLKEYPVGYLASFPFYSEEERKFRFLRDRCLSFEDYSEIMNRMMVQTGHSREKISQTIWMTKEHVKVITDAGSEIGLHSFSHPTRISSFPVVSQRAEYERNFFDLQELTGNKPRFVAHPCGDYSTDTLAILRSLGVSVGFRSSPTRGGKTHLEIPREDHSVICDRMDI